MAEYDLLKQAPLAPVEEARSAADLSAAVAGLRAGPDWSAEGATIEAIRGEVDAEFIHHADHYRRMLHGGTRPDGSTYGGTGGLRSVRMMVDEGVAEVVIAGSHEWDASRHSYLSRIRFANYALIASQPFTWTERARLLMRDDVRVHCSCPAFKYYHAHAATEKGFALIPEDVPAPVRNPEDRGGVCKHLEHALRYVAANYTTIAGAMKRHSQPEESTMLSREPPVQTLRDLVESLRTSLEVYFPLTEAARETSEVDKVRYNADRKGYNKKEHGDPDLPLYFYHTPQPAGSTKPMAYGDKQALSPVREKVYGADGRWASRTTRRKQPKGQAPRWRQMVKGKGEHYLDTGVAGRVLVDVAQDLHPKMASIYNSARDRGHPSTSSHASLSDQHGRPAFGPGWWDHPAVHEFLKQYDPAQHAEDTVAGAPIPAHRGMMHPAPGLAALLTTRWAKAYKANNGYDEAKGEWPTPEHAKAFSDLRKEKVKEYNGAHHAVHYHLHQLMKNPDLVGKKSRLSFAVEDKTPDAGAGSAPNAGRRDPNWDREDFSSWEHTKSFLKSRANAAVLIGNAIPNKEGNVAQALVHGLTHQIATEPDHDKPALDSGVVRTKPRLDAGGKAIVEPRPDAAGYWKPGVYNIRKRSMYRTRASIRYGEDGKQVLDVHDAPRPAHDAAFAKGGEFDTPKTPTALPANEYERERLRWRDEVARSKHRDRENSMKSTSMKNLSHARKVAKGTATAAGDLSFLDALDGPATPAHSPSATAEPSGKEFSLIRGHAPQVRRTDPTKNRIAAKLHNAGVFDFLHALGPAEPAKPSAPPKPSAPALPSIDLNKHAGEIDAIHAELKKTDPEAERTDAEVVFKMRKRGIKAVESLPLPIRLHLLGEGVGSDITLAIQGVLAKARKAGFSRTYAQMVQALNQASSEGGSPTTTPADPRAPMGAPGQ